MEDNNYASSDDWVEKVYEIVVNWKTGETKTVSRTEYISWLESMSRVYGKKYDSYYDAVKEGMIENKIAEFKEVKEYIKESEECRRFNAIVEKVYQKLVIEGWVNISEEECRREARKIIDGEKH